MPGSLNRRPLGYNAAATMPRLQDLGYNTEVLAFHERHVWPFPFARDRYLFILTDEPS